MPGFPLKGIRVTDLTWQGAGPFTAKNLADHGADVIRIESNRRLDTLRSARPFKDGIPGLNRSGHFNNRNTNKRDILLDLKHPKARDIALKIISTSDVLVNNMGPGSLDKVGLGYEDCRVVRPDIVYLVATINGTEGPDRDETGGGNTVTALAGLNHLSGRADMEPIGTNTPYSDHVTVPCHATFAILAALRHRRRTGEGQFIDVSQVETMVSLLGPVMMDYSVNGRDAMREANRVSYAAPHGVYQCSGPGDDRWITIAATNEDEWRELVEGLGKVEWLTDARFATLAGRKQNEDALDEAMAEATRQWDAYELMETLRKRRVPVGVVQTNKDLIERDPQERFRGHFVTLDHPETGPSIYDRPPFQLSGMTEPPLRTPAPLLGQHNYEVYGEIFGWSKEEVDRLIEEGVIG